MLFGLDGRDVLFDRGGSSVDELLGIHKAKASDGLDGLDDGDLGSTDTLEDEGDFGRALVDRGLFLGGGSGGSGDRGGDAEFSFDSFDELKREIERNTEYAKKAYLKYI